MNILRTIYNLTVDDEIFADLDLNGRQIVSLKGINFSSVNDIVRTIMSKAGEFAGLAKLNIRNKTQGWNMMMGIASQRKATMSDRSKSAFSRVYNTKGVQLSIPWN